MRAVRAPSGREPCLPSAPAPKRADPLTSERRGTGHDRPGDVVDRECNVGHLLPSWSVSPNGTKGMVPEWSLIEAIA